MTQSWHDLLFAHWRVNERLLRPHVPAAFDIDRFDGSAWLVPHPGPAEIEPPGERERHGQTEHGGDDYGAHGPFRQIELRENRVRDLDREPREAAVPSCGPEHLSTAKFGDQ